MNPLLALLSENISVNWETVQLGLRGPGSAPPQIGLQDVRSWLEVELGGDREPPRAFDVIGAIHGDDRPGELIAALAGSYDPSDVDELRKWQFLMLRRQLSELPDDPFYAVLELADFWAQFGDDPTVPIPSPTILAAHVRHQDLQRVVGDQEQWLARTRGLLRQEAEQ